MASMASLTSSAQSLPLRWLLLIVLLVYVLIFVSILVILPVYTICLALITIIRANNYFVTSPRDEQKGEKNNSGSRSSNSGPWSNICTSIFQGRVFHVRQRPKIHSFQYPLTFSVVDLDEACGLFGNRAVAPDCSSVNSDSKESDDRGKLWPMSTLMLLRDEDHLKNGEGLPTATTKDATQITTKLSMKERVINLLHERTNGKLDLKQQPPRKILLVTHLMYFGYCFNPVSFFFILNQQQTEIEAVVVEVSNTPWNEMSIYVLHPDSVDTTLSQVYPSNSTKSLAKDGNMKANTYHYQCEKKFHVSPFMTMDHDYDWKFQLDEDRIVVQAQMYKHATEEEDVDNTNEEKKDGSDDSNKGILYFTAGFDIHRTINPTTQSYPLQLSKIILRYPIYCFVIQIWIHYEALKLLLKGIQFIPHPEGSETGASKAIAVVMGPVFVVMDVMNDLFVRLKGGGGEKTMKVE
eukprot:scaffold6403_cov128-Skeletonema_dohrnii-CCMP3373.AAC.4